MRTIACIALVSFLLAAAFGQSIESTATFEIADVHTSARTTNPVFRVITRAGRYELRNATMVDLIRMAYSVNAENVVGGPNWIEFDRFDVIGLVPPNKPAETQKLMLQALLADRFKLVMHHDTRSLTGFVLSMGRGKPKLKEATGSGNPGCQSQSLPAPAPVPGQIVLPLTAVSCHNMTMAAFASELRRLGVGYVTNTIVDSTGLKGSWDFDLKWTQKILLQMTGAEGTTLFDAIDKQLGLKLEEQKMPTPVIVVDDVNEKPTANLPDVATKLPPPPPAEFEVADIKLVDPNAPRTPTQIGLLPGGRVNLPSISLRFLITLAWNLNLAVNEEIAGAPKWIDSAAFDIIAKAPAGTTGSLLDLGPMLQNLLIDRFKMKAHFEDRPVTAYTLVTVKHKLKKADPSTRTGCKSGTGPAVANALFGLAPRAVTCQNITMAQFADQLQIIGGSYIRYPVVDGTALEGAWDFTITFSPIPPSQLAGLRGAPPAVPAAGAGLEASDPIGGTSLFDAVEKQLGLKLEMQKRAYPVFVIDHIEEKPTDN
jgi:uncharacterized protein (TIGR03435 family)